MAYELHAEIRKGTGKSVTRKLRAQGKIPAVMYGAGEPTQPLTLDLHEVDTFFKKTRGESVVITLKVDGEVKQVLPKEVQRDPVTGRILHVDFLILHKGEKVIVEVPIVTVGESVGVKKGGVLEVLLRSVEVRAEPANLPSHIEVEITNLDLGDVVHVRDLPVPEGVEILEDPDEPVVTILIPRAAEEEAEAAPEEEVPPTEAPPTPETPSEEGSEG